MSGENADPYDISIESELDIRKSYRAKYPTGIIDMKKVIELKNKRDGTPDNVVQLRKTEPQKLAAKPRK